jgi:hypothetical protein
VVSAAYPLRPYYRFCSPDDAIEDAEIMHLRSDFEHFNKEELLTRQTKEFWVVERKRNGLMRSYGL